MVPRPIRLIGLLAVALALPPTIGSAAWADARLCSGYEQCRAGGYSDADYGVNSGGAYWNMVAGHNCTNYVAYRLVRAGLPNVRPPADPGERNNRLDAYLWGQVYASRTDSTPAVGSVAWWAADAGRGAIGHVAYVEAVDPDGSITISEDSSSGHDFDWKRIEPGRGWPSGFIHFGRVDAAPAAPPRTAPRTEPRDEPRAEPRYEPRYEPRFEPRYEPRTQPRNAPRSAPREQAPMRRTAPAGRYGFEAEPMSPPDAMTMEPAGPARARRAAHRAHRVSRPRPVGDCSGAMAGAVCPDSGAEPMGRASLPS